MSADHALTEKAQGAIALTQQDLPGGGAEIRLASGERVHTVTEAERKASQAAAKKVDAHMATHEGIVAGLREGALRAVDAETVAIDPSYGAGAKGKSSIIAIDPLGAGDRIGENPAMRYTADQDGKFRLDPDGSGRREIDGRTVVAGVAGSSYAVMSWLKDNLPATRE